MNRFIRILLALVLAIGTVGLLSTATAYAQTQLGVQAANQTGTVAGSIRDASGAPVSNATVKLAGPATLTATTDARGRFSFLSITPGIYSFAATKAGYDTASESSIAIIAGQTQTLTVTMNALTFSSLRTIATVRAAGRGTFNTTPASVNVVSSQTFTDQAQPQVMRALNQTPGVVASYPQTSANGSVPGAITFPNIRGALSFETASLIDGHPVSVGTYGDYVTTFMNSFALSTIELVKGPGADAPEVNYAIGGTVNFRTKDPTFLTTGNFTFGYGSHGSTLENFSYSDTVGRLGIVFDFAENNDPGAINGYQASFVPGGNNTYINYNPATQTGTYVGYNDTAMSVGGTSSALYNSFGTVACCYTMTAGYDSKAELLKLRYKFSGATSATFAYLGSQTWADQNANTSSQIFGTFVPGSNYNGTLTPGSTVLMTNLHPGGTDQEINNEPILEGDLRTTLGNDTILARYYHASIDRLIREGPASPWTPETMVLNIQGTNGQKASSANITGLQPVTFFDFYNQEEIDKLAGYSLEWNHPLGDRDVLTFAADTTNSTTTSDSASPFLPFNGPLNANTIGTNYSVSVPAGSKQVFTTYLLRGNFMVAPKLNAVFSNYLNTYGSTYPTACAPVSVGVNPKQCYPDGTGYTFTMSNTSHYDPRLSLEYRAQANLALRFAAGSAIAPPYLNLLAGIPGSFRKVGTGAAAFNTEVINAGNLLAETAFGYDLGGDYRFNDGATTVSGDVYTTNLFNHFMTQYFNSGVCTNPACPVPGAPLELVQNVNLANSRFEGIELSLRRNPPAGVGFVMQGALQKGYAYNLPPYFYCEQPGPGCTPNTNLAVIPNQNFTGGAIGAPTGVGFNGFSNQNIPYLQAYGQLSYRFPSGIYAQVNETVLGKNNSLNVPPFGILNASLRFPVGGIALEVAGDNLTNAWSGLFPIQGGGIGLPLANGGVGATTQNVIGPSTIHVLLIKNFGKGSNPAP